MTAVAQPSKMSTLPVASWLTRSQVEPQTMIWLGPAALS
jgi:hypothetical protein